MEPTFITRWLYRCVNQGEVKPGRYLCAVCGLPTTEGTPPKRVFRNTFTDYSALRNPESRLICPACVWYMDTQQIRRLSWVVDESSAQQVAYADWFSLLKAHLEAPPEMPRYYSIKAFGMVARHTPLYAELNYDDVPLRVRYNKSTLDIGPAWAAAAEAAYELRQNHSWREIIEDDYIVKFIAEKVVDFVHFEELRGRLRPYLRTPYAELIKLLWRKPAAIQEEEESYVESDTD